MCGSAVLVSGAGEAASGVPASRALCASVRGRHAGEAPLGTAGVRAPERLPPLASTAATAPPARTARSGTM